jgi:hypothetical protein
MTAAAIRIAPARALTAEEIDQLLYYASLAPSPHNAQGWAFDVHAGNQIDVRLDRRRQVLGELDPQAKEGHLAVGAAVENLCVAARHLGWAPHVAWLPDDRDRDLLARIELAPAPPCDDGSLLALTTRATNRSHHRPRPVDPRVLAALGAIASAEGFQLTVLTERTAISRVAELAGRASAFKLAHHQTRAELQDLLRFSSAEAAESRDGLAFDLLAPGMARLGRLLMGKATMRALVPFGYARILARSAEEMPIRSSPAVALLSVRSGNPAALRFLRGGQVFNRIALEATAAGLSLQPHSAPIEVGLARPAEHAASIPKEWIAALDRIGGDLRAEFALAADATPIVLFRLGHPLHTPERRSLRRPVSPPAPSDDGFYRELTTRNQGVVSDAAQEKLRGMRIGIFGCGSIGGAPVENLARLGAERFTLAEPGTYELNNLNRQAATLVDVGRNKAEVLRERIQAINPSAGVLVEPRGVSAENVHYLVGTSDVIVDGVDVTEPAGIEAKILLHREAWRQRKVVILGLDMGGTQLVRIHDYREDRSRPLDGRFDGVPAAGLSAPAFLMRMLSPIDVPADMIRIAERVLHGETPPMPQLAPTAAQFGVIASWAILELASGKSLRKEIRIDLPGVVAPPLRRVRDEARRMVSLVRLKLLLERARLRG